MPAAKIVIPAEDLRTMTIKEIMEKYGCSDSVVSKRRTELGISTVRSRRGPAKSLPPDIREKAIRYYRDGLTLKVIWSRLRQHGYGQLLIRQALIEEFGSLSSARRKESGWCAL